MGSTETIGSGHVEQESRCCRGSDTVRFGGISDVSEEYGASMFTEEGIKRGIVNCCRVVHGVLLRARYCHVHSEPKVTVHTS